MQVPSTYIFVFKYLNTSFAAIAWQRVRKIFTVYSPRGSARVRNTRRIPYFPSLPHISPEFFEISQLEVTACAHRSDSILSRDDDDDDDVGGRSDYRKRDICDREKKKKKAHDGGLSSRARRLAGALLIISTLVRNCSLFSE